MARALYRKYRSKNLSEIVGQEHVTTALSNALKNGRIGHAYLFTGPRGVGKTSIARILAHEVNDLPYDEATTHLDIIEIDAASNRRIDEIRTLRERVHNAPTSAKYKVYIIDEVHMLTKEAFNALLKTLEEPPEHVIFILATTEAHKLPETIISRTQRFTFKPAQKTDAAEHLKSIAKSEGIDISDEALELVAHHGQGSFRDSISLLDQVSNTSGSIGITEVQRSLGIAPDEAIANLIEALARGDTADLLKQLDSLKQQGYQAPQIANQLGQTLRSHLLDNKSQLDGEAATALLQKLINVPAAHDPHALLEIILIEPSLSMQPAAVAPPAPTPVQTTLEEPKPNKPEPIPEPEAKEKPTPEPEPEPEVPAAPTPTGETALMDETGWQQVLLTLKKKHNTLYGIARMAVPIFDDGKLTLNFSFPFHQKRMNDPKNRQIISDIIKRDFGVVVEIVCVVDKQAKPAPTPKVEERPEITETKETKPESGTQLDTINNIFGGGEIIE